MGSGAVDYRQLLLHNDQNSLNLGTVRERVVQLKDSLDGVIRGLSTSAQVVHWEHVLEKFAVINVQYQNLLESLRGTLKTYCVYPKAVASAQVANILPIMLATKLLPEMEAADSSSVRGVEASLSASGVSQEGWFMALDNQKEVFNALIDHLTITNPSVTGSGVLDPKGSARQELAKLSRAVQAAAAPVKPGAVTTAAKPVSNQNVKRKREPEDVLYAMVLNGEGLREGMRGQPVAMGTHNPHSGHGHGHGR